MTDSPLVPRERVATALGLLAWAELVLICTWVLSPTLSRALFALSSRETFETFSTLLKLFEVAPLALIMFGVLRFVAPLDDAGTRRLAHAAVFLLGLGMAVSLFGKFTSVTFVAGEVEMLSRISYHALGFAPIPGTAMMLLVVWRGCRALSAPPPRGLFIFIASLMALSFVMESVRLFLPWQSVLLQARYLLGYSLEALLAGALFLARAELLRTREAPADRVEWWNAAQGLALYQKGLGAILASGLLGLFFHWLVRSSSARAFISGLSTVVLVAGIVVVFTGLFGYVRMPEASEARAPAHLGLGLLVLAVMALIPMSGVSWLGLAARVLALVGTLLLLESFHRVALALEAPKSTEPEPTTAAIQVRRWMALSGGAVLALRFFDISGGFPGLVLLVAWGASLIAMVRFLLLVNRLKHQMREKGAPTAEPPLFQLV